MEWLYLSLIHKSLHKTDSLFSKNINMHLWGTFKSISNCQLATIICILLDLFLMYIPLMSLENHVNSSNLYVRGILSNCINSFLLNKTWCVEKLIRWSLFMIIILKTCKINIWNANIEHYFSKNQKYSI